MKNSLLYIAVLLMPITGFAQKPAVKESMPTIIFPENYNSESFREELVAEAMKNASGIKIASRETQIEKYRVGITKSKWLDYFTVSGNLNEFTLNPGKYQNQALFFPRYNFGVSIPLGSLFSNSYDTKIASNQYLIAKENEKASTLTLRSEVLSKFEEYVQSREALSLQSQVFNDQETVHTLNEGKFKSNVISLEEFNESSRQLFDLKSKALDLQKQYAITKYQLEALIGAIIIDSRL
jgi:outer membrane protein TolC